MATLTQVMRVLGVVAVCLTLVVLMPGCESTGHHDNGNGDAAMASATCGLEGCDRAADAGVSAMVDGRKANFCCAGCKASALSN